MGAMRAKSEIRNQLYSLTVISELGTYSGVGNKGSASGGSAARSAIEDAWHGRTYRNSDRNPWVVAYFSDQIDTMQCSGRFAIVISHKPVTYKSSFATF
jgi:hypothetical protein